MVRIAYCTVLLTYLLLIVFVRFSLLIGLLCGVYAIVHTGAGLFLGILLVPLATYTITITAGVLLIPLRPAAKNLQDRL